MALSSKKKRFWINVKHGIETQIHYGMSLFYILMSFGEFYLDYKFSEYIKEMGIVGVV